jgi:ABC-type multidrug transport system fused ATPase/permease subunit
MDIMGKIEFKGVGFTYPTRPEAPIFKGLSFTLNPGKTVAIVGHSGCGKSTIAQLLLRFYDPDAGTITIDGIDIKDLDVCWLRESVMGIVSQEPTLFASTIMENIRYGSPNATDEQVIEAAKQANAHEFISQFPGGYNTYVGERGHAISGGLDFVSY